MTVSRTSSYTRCLNAYIPYEAKVVSFLGNWIFTGILHQMKKWKRRPIEEKILFLWHY